MRPQLQVFKYLGTSLSHLKPKDFTFFCNVRPVLVYIFPSKISPQFFRSIQGIQMHKNTFIMKAISEQSIDTTKQPWKSEAKFHHVLSASMTAWHLSHLQMPQILLCLCAKVEWINLDWTLKMYQCQSHNVMLSFEGMQV